MTNKTQKLNARRLLHWVDKFRATPVLVVGDIMVDRFFRGSADRISPEAPVPVVHVREQGMTPGGSGHVVSNLASLGAQPSLIALRGDDQTGDELQSELSRRGVDVRGILIDSDPTRPTITKTRIFAGHQQVARFDMERCDGLPPHLSSDVERLLKAFIPRHKAVVISDYGKGFVSARLIATVIKEARKKNIPIVVDPKIEHFLRYKGVDCITPNTKEAVEGGRANPPKNEEEFVSLGAKILRMLRTKSLLITRGDKGMTLFQPAKKPVTIPAIAQQVYDVTGAGDTVVATFTLARAAGAPYEEAAQLANLAASLVVAKVGTAVVTCDELTKRIRDLA